MFGAVIRAAAAAAISVPFMALLALVLGDMLPFMDAPSDSLISQIFTGVLDWALLIMGLAILAGLIVRAVVERQVGGGYR